MNQLYFGDNLDILKSLYKQNKSGFIDLIYIDPPFNSKRNYNVLFESINLNDSTAQKEAFADTWSNVSYLDSLNELADIDIHLYNFLKQIDNVGISLSAISYLTTMAIRIWYMHKLLNNTGSFYLHCDPTMSHYLKILCDIIFKGKNFRNEIVWTYRGGGSSKKDFGKKHDVILRYSKSNNYLFFPDNIRIPYQAEGLQRKDDSMWGRHKGTNKIYKPHPEGKIPEDWWPFNILNANDPERVGYPTQKPEALMERIIQASTKEQDLVADFFCGCGTTIAVAERLKRRWMGVDISHLAIRLIADRIGKEKINKTFEIHGFPKDLASARELANNVKGGRLEFEEWVVEFLLNGILNEKRNEMGFDGYRTFDANGKKQIVLIEVKSGHVSMAQFSHFIKTVSDKNGSMGIFVCFAGNVTKKMKIIANNEGSFEINGHRFADKIQIATIEDLLINKMPKIPESKKETFKKIEKKSIEKDSQITLNL